VDCSISCLRGRPASRLLCASMLFALRASPGLMKEDILALLFKLFVACSWWSRAQQDDIRRSRVCRMFFLGGDALSSGSRCDWLPISLSLSLMQRRSHNWTSFDYTRRLYYTFQLQVQRLSLLHLLSLLRAFLGLWGLCFRMLCVMPFMPLAFIRLEMLYGTLPLGSMPPSCAIAAGL